jgi:hypothetical protein
VARADTIAIGAADGEVDAGEEQLVTRVLTLPCMSLHPFCVLLVFLLSLSVPACCRWLHG